MDFFQTFRCFDGGRPILSIALVFFSFFSAGLAQEETTAGDPVKIFNQGQNAHETGDYKTALKFYDEALKLFAEFPEAEFQRGNALVSLNNTAEAEIAFRRAIQLRPDWTLPMTNLGALLVQKNEFAEAEKFLAKAVETEPLNFSAFAALTDLRLKTKASPQVLNQLLVKLQFLTAKAKPNAAVWASRAALENALGDKAAAKASLSRALIIENNNKSALATRAEIALAENDFERATEDAKTLVRLSPDAVFPKLLQARVLVARDKPDEALKILDGLKNPSSEATLLHDTIISNSSTDAGALEKQLEKNPKNPAVLSRLCAVLRTANPVKALDFCRRASEAEPNNINHAVGFAAALVPAKQFEAAAVVLRRILQAAPDNFAARANLATALFELKRFAEAKTEYRRLTEQQPDLPIAYYFLAIAHDNLNEYADAMANYQLFLQRADSANNRLEIEKVNLRLPALQKQIKKK